MGEATTTPAPAPPPSPRGSLAPQCRIAGPYFRPSFFRTGVAVCSKQPALHQERGNPPKCPQGFALGLIIHALSSYRAPWEDWTILMAAEVGAPPKKPTRLEEPPAGQSGCHMDVGFALRTEEKPYGFGARIARFSH